MSDSPSVLDQLKQHTIVVADTGDFESIREYEPRDATTNPEPHPQGRFSRSLCGPRRRGRLHCKVRGRVGRRRSHGPPTRKVRHGNTRYRSRSCLHRGRRPSLLQRRGQSWPRPANSFQCTRQPATLAIASSSSLPLPGKASRPHACLEQEGIHCNMTLLFSHAQAIACAEAGSQLISPFVGRILDWHKASSGKEFSRSRRSRRTVRYRHIQLLQKIRSRDRGHGS